MCRLRDLRACSEETEAETGKEQQVHTVGMKEVEGWVQSARFPWGVSVGLLV